MLTKKDKRFTYIFSIIVIAELLCGSIEKLAQLQYITKPAIVISLLFIFWKESQMLSKSIRIMTLSALAFSLLGDVLLMFVAHSPIYFMFGLVAFLIAHLLYIFVFLKRRNLIKKPIALFVFFIIYATVLMLLLMDGLGEMLFPVLLYMVVILTMATMAFLREGMVSKTSYYFVCIGAVMFLISDSLLAINKFNGTFVFANTLIMLTYAMAQYFIVFGIKKQL